AVATGAAPAMCSIQLVRRPKTKEVPIPNRRTLSRFPSARPLLATGRNVHRENWQQERRTADHTGQVSATDRSRLRTNLLVAVAILAGPASAVVEVLPPLAPAHARP